MYTPARSEFAPKFSENRAFWSERGNDCMYVHYCVCRFDESSQVAKTLLKSSRQHIQLEP
jgi:hypothetical protein